MDLAWLRMDHPRHPMTIVGLWRLAPALELAVLRQRVQQRVLPHPRFRQRTAHGAQGWVWEADPAFDLARHVVVEPLGRRRGETVDAALQRLLGALISRPLDPRYPRWQFHLIADERAHEQAHRAGDEGLALVLRVSHALADGMALIPVLQGLADGVASAPLAPPDPAGGPGPSAASQRAGLGAFGAQAGAEVDAFELPQGLLEDAAALALMPDDAATPLKGRASGDKRVAWTAPWPLDEVKGLGRALGCSVNDVLVACVAEALAQELHARGHAPAGRVRALVPVNLRPPGDAAPQGNHFGLAPVLLPVAAGDPIARLQAVAAELQRLKAGYQPALSLALLHAGGWLHPAGQDALLGSFMRKSTLVLTNVPGSPQALELGGSRIREALFWVPTAGDIGLGISVMSQGGQVQFGVAADAAVCPDPQALADRLRPAFEALLHLALMLPWTPDEGRAAVILRP